MFDWNDLRYFLAVARTGSTLAAGRALRVSQTTVARRVSALEQALAVTLFDRRQAGYALTPEGEALLARAEAVEAKAESFAHAAAAQARETGGTVRLTADGLYSTTLLVPLLRDLHEAHPEIRIELDTSSQVRDLAAGAADVALRIAVRPEGSGLVGRRIADDVWAVYCSRAYAGIHGAPHRLGDLYEHDFIGGGGQAVWRVYGDWLRQNGLEGKVTMMHDSVNGLLAAVRAGLGLAVLPTLIADFEPDLVRCLPPAPSDRGLWLLTHERLRRTPRIRSVLDFLGARLTRRVREMDARHAADPAG